MERITYVSEPTDLQCGQAVLAMLTGIPIDEIIAVLHNDRETTLKEMLRILDASNIGYIRERKQAFSKADLPPLALLSLETPRCWHWSLYADGIFYDPEHGVLSDFPQAARKYYWELFPGK